MLNHQHKYFIAVAGNIGAGKSTLTGMLSQTFSWEPFYEANADNPYLADFYADMPRWSFHSQVFFLGKRLEHHKQLVDHQSSVVQDRTIYEDAEIFARNLYEQGTLAQRDYEVYQRLYQAIGAFLPPPDLVIYLQGSVDKLTAHINKRGREYERTIAPDYLARLNRLYDSWIDNWTTCPIVRVPMDRIDFLQNREDFEEIVQMVNDALTPHVAMS